MSRPVGGTAAGAVERWRRMEALLDAALELPSEAREAWLRRECGDDTGLYARVVRLIDGGERDDGFLRSPAAELAAGLVAAVPGADPSDATAPAPARVGPYRIVRELGRGGMGTVYLAEREEHFAQRVALKLVRHGLHRDDQFVRRFIAERQILASLEHPNIARLLDGGVTSDGLPWFAMEFVDGEPVDAACDARMLSVDARLALFCTVCDAVEVAHRRFVVHRDLKPSNILVTADGIPKLLDFGIAKLVAGDEPAGERLTQTGTRLLTPEYASPEQVRGEPVTATSDVYSLGVLLFELLTGRRPYRITGRTPHEIERAILDHEPGRPSSVVTHVVEDAIRPGRPAHPDLEELARARGATPGALATRLRGELDAIVLRAIAKAPSDRYPTAAALAEDVRRHLTGRPVLARSPRTRRRWIAVGVVAGAAALAALGTAIARRPARTVGRPAADLPVIAVGRIADYRATAADSGLARPLADLLATNLARIPGLRVVSTGRIYEIIEQLGAAGNVTGAEEGRYTAAARRAGASNLIDGSIYALPPPDGGLRLDVRRVDIPTGAVLASRTVSGRDVFSLADSVTGWLATTIGLSAPSGSIADVTTRSEIAYRFYVEGLRTFYRGDAAAAEALFDAALAQDSTFAMAAYYRAAASSGVERRELLARYALAMRLADRASDRERLIIRTAWEIEVSDPNVLATAETLSVRYPQELAGPLALGRALVEAGRLEAALRRLRQVVTLDSASLGASAARCTACEAQRDIIGVYILMDSLPAAAREARAWAALRPRSAVAWRNLSLVLHQLDDRDAGRDAYRRAAALDPKLKGSPDFYAYNYVLHDEYEIADAALREIARSGTEDWRAEAQWYLAISLRRQGRFIEALAAARANREAVERQDSERAPSYIAVQHAQVLLELGRPRESLALFDSLAQWRVPGDPPSSVARYWTWAMAHGANALAALGDTAQLRVRADSMEVIGARSLLARDQRLHHHVRGLLLSLRGDDAEAVEEFRRAMVYPVPGYTQTNLALARSLMRLGRAREAVSALQPAMTKAIEASYLYVSETELREQLARAWDMAGERDSALVHYQAVAQAWRRADPQLQDRVTAVQRRIEALR